MSLEIKKLAVLPSDNCLIINPQNHAIDIELPLSNETNNPTWVMIVATNANELTTLIGQHTELLYQARVIWMSYPKKSGNVKSDLNRDISWKLLVPFKLTPVSQISLDENWSSLRFKYGELPPNWVETYLDKKKSPADRPELIVPLELNQAFLVHQDAKIFFEGLSYSCKREYIQYITEAKKQETRDRRTQNTIDALLAKKKYRN